MPPALRVGLEARLWVFEEEVIAYSIVHPSTHVARDLTQF